MEWLNLLSRLISFNCCGLFDYISFIPINLLGYKKSFFNVMVWILFSYRVLIRKSAIRLINALVWNAVWITKTNFIKDFDKVFNISLFGPFLFQTQLFYLSFQSVQHMVFIVIEYYCAHFWLFQVPLWSLNWEKIVDLTSWYLWSVIFYNDVCLIFLLGSF